jgi:Mrp family chromosome partitioning ATPase
MILGRSGLHLFEIERRDTTSWSRIVDATLAERANAYDLVAVDLPPLCCRPQFQLAAQKLDGVLLVLKWGKTEWERLCRLLDLPEELRGKFIGALVNGINNSAIGRYDRFWSAEAELCARRGTRQTFYGPASLAPAGTAGV